MRPDHKRREIPVAENQVSGEQPAKEHDFRQQEKPHGKARSIHLLVHGLKVVALIGRVLVPSVRGLGDRLAIRHWLPLLLLLPGFCARAIRSRRHRGPSLVSRHSSRSTAAIESATPAPLPARDYCPRSRRTSTTTSDTESAAGSRRPELWRRQWRTHSKFETPPGMRR